MSVAMAWKNERIEVVKEGWRKALAVDVGLVPDFEPKIAQPHWMQ